MEESQLAPMSVGYFHWSRLLTHCGLKKQKSETKSNEVRGQMTFHEFSDRRLHQKLSESNRAGVPTTTQYIAATGKEVLKLLESAAGILLVPLLQDTIRIAIKIIEVCEVC